MSLFYLAIHKGLIAHTLLPWLYTQTVYMFVLLIDVKQVTKVIVLEVKV